MASAKTLVLVTGANQGIGFAVAKLLSSSGQYHVLVSARSSINAQMAVEQLQNEAADKTALTPIMLDVADDASIEEAARGVSGQFGYLDILINNAGIGQAPDLPVREMYRQIFEVNVFGVAAKGYAFNANAWYAPEYCTSKAALNMITAAQSVKFADDKIAVIAAAPGMCHTKFTGGQGRKEASDDAKVIVRAATEGNPEELTGTYICDEPSDGW
ncbi:hypothetical protein GGR58DRAFT_512829 [Xylaria digitata]|nr:hypothetical protein GGR58DRAFT_512829 [Xylaria digitata]